MNPTTTMAATAIILQLAAPTRRQNHKPEIAMPTLVEIKQQELEQEVCNIYREVESVAHTASWHQRAVQVAAKTGLSPEGIKKILERNGITNPNKRTNNGCK